MSLILGHKEKRKVIQWNIGNIYAKQHNLIKTEKYIGRAVEIAEQTGHHSQEKYHLELKIVRAMRQVAQEQNDMG